MRRTLDCAIALLPTHHDWMLGWRDSLGPLPESVRLVPLPLAAMDSTPGDSSLPAGHALRQLGPQLARYDICLLPVTLTTLVWSRIALAESQGHLPVPLLGLFGPLQPGPATELLHLGLHDALWHTAPWSEVHTRLVYWSRPHHPPPRPTPRPASRRSSTGQGLAVPAGPHADGWQGSFQATRGHWMATFERAYVRHMLDRHQGNVTHAARAGEQNRRAFWELMRKHAISASPYRGREPGPVDTKGAGSVCPTGNSALPSVSER